jgi:hypothetical protein
MLNAVNNMIKSSAGIIMPPLGVYLRRRTGSWHALFYGVSPHSPALRCPRGHPDGAPLLMARGLYVERCAARGVGTGLRRVG